MDAFWSKIALNWLGSIATLGACFCSLYYTPPTGGGNSLVQLQCGPEKVANSLTEDVTQLSTVYLHSSFGDMGTEVRCIADLKTVGMNFAPDKEREQENRDSWRGQGV